MKRLLIEELEVHEAREVKNKWLYKSLWMWLL